MDRIVISPKNPFYFATERGAPYIPLGPNLCFPRFVHREDDVLGQMEEWLEKLSRHGGNFFRLWLSHPTFAVERERSGYFDEAFARRVDRVLEMAASRNIHANLCMEHFRSLDPKPDIFPGAANFGNPLHHQSQGGPANSMDEFWSSPESRSRFKKKLGFLLDRWGNLPQIALWELWNEIDAVEGIGFDDWTRAMLAEIKRISPKSLAAQSLGGWEYLGSRSQYEKFLPMANNDVALVHRYLNEAGDPTLTGGPIDLLSANAIRDARVLRPKGPILLGEGGAVEPHHSAPWRHYPSDRDGIVLHDVLFAPFFAGAAGAGMIWHWDFYLDKMNLWFHFDRFRQATQNLDPIVENVIPITLEHPELRIAILKGNKRSWIWLRDKQNDWKSEFGNHTPPRFCHSVSIDLSSLAVNISSKAKSVYDPWENRWKPFSKVTGTQVTLPDFQRSLILQL